MHTAMSTTTTKRDILQGSSRVWLPRKEEAEETNKKIEQQQQDLDRVEARSGIVTAVKK
jgi:hypothetical protein